MKKHFQGQLLCNIKSSRHYKEYRAIELRNRNCACIKRPLFPLQINLMCAMCTYNAYSDNNLLGAYRTMILAGWILAPLRNGAKLILQLNLKLYDYSYYNQMVVTEAAWLPTTRIGVKSVMIRLVDDCVKYLGCISSQVRSLVA